MIKRLVVELSEALCDCPVGTPLALDIKTSKEDGGFQFQTACIGCDTYLSIPLNKLRALIKLDDEEVPQALPSKKPMKPKLVLIQGGQSPSMLAENDS